MSNSEDIDGERALDWAMYRPDQRRIEVLKQYGAEPGSGLRHQTYPAPEGDCGCPDLAQPKRVLIVASGPGGFPESWLHQLP
jgi:hypothetical protein